MSDLPFLGEGGRNYDLWLELLSRLGRLKRIHGPFDGGVSVGMAQNVEATFLFTHNLHITGTQVVVGFLYDGFFSAAFGWRASTAADSLTVVIHNLRSTSGGADSAGWRGVILEFS